MEIDKLIQDIKNGDEQAFASLLDEHHNMIYKIIYGLNLERGDYRIDVDSLFQEGSIALYKAVYSYEDGYNMNFTSYAYMVIRARLHTYLRDAYRYLNNECISLDNTESVDYQIFNKKCLISENPIDYYREKQFEEHLNKFMAKLSKEDQEIFKLRSDDFSYKQIAERLNIKSKKVDNRLRVLRKRLKKHLKEAENG